MTESVAYGAGRRLKDGLTRLLRLRYERGLGDTAGTIAADDLGLDDPDFFHYQPSAWTSLQRALDGRSIGSEDVFLDLGCGKGRVLWLAASEYPFGRVIGVEIVPELAEFARANLDAGRDRLRAGEATVVVANAAEFEIPDDVSVLYMFSPFGGGVFAAVIDNLVASLDRRPRALTLIYAHPELESVIEASGRFDLARVLKPRLRPQSRRGAWVNVYESRAEVGGGGGGARSNASR